MIKNDDYSTVVILFVLYPHTHTQHTVRERVRIVYYIHNKRFKPTHTYKILKKKKRDESETLHTTGGDVRSMYR